MQSNEGIVVVSLFDGMSCGQQALEKQKVKVKQYYASEIDKHAIKVTMANYPNTIQLGSVVDVKTEDLPRVDFICGGSPCQSFSFAGKRKGMSTKDEQEILTLNHYLKLKEEGYEFEGQSYLFWEFMRILTALRLVNPDIKFLLENVRMTEKWQNCLSAAIGVNPVMINSTLLSAQNRERLYWTNIGLEPSGFFGDLMPTIRQPKDKRIFLKHILETEVAEKYFLSDKMINYLHTRGANFNNGKVNYKTGVDKASFINASSGHIDISDNIIVDETERKSGCFTAGGNSGGLHSQMELIVHSTKPRSGDPTKGGTGHLSRTDGKTYCLDTGNSNAVEIVQSADLVQVGNIYDNENNSVAGRVYTDKGKSVTLSALGGGGGAKTGLYQIHSRIRRLTPIECERLQCVKDNYTNHVSDTQRYRMLGNGWTIDVICHILSYWKINQ